MIVTLSYFPDKYIELMNRTLEEIGSVTLVDIKPNITGTSSIVRLECSDPTYVWLFGMWMGNKEMVESIRGAMPKVEENIDRLIKKIEEPSNN